MVEFFGLPFMEYTRFVNFVVETFKVELSNDAIFVAYMVYHLIKYYFIVQIVMFLKYVFTFIWNKLRR